MLLFNLNDFGPFFAEVWGTVSDCLMVIVTGITAKYIYMTFKAQDTFNRKQLEINEQQKEINRLSMEKYRREIRPYFKFNFDTNWINSSKTIHLLLHDNVAYHVAFIYRNTPTYRVEGIMQFQAEIPVGQVIEVKLTSITNELVAGDSLTGLIIVFDDEDGRVYYLRLDISPLKEISISVPTLVKNRREFADSLGAQ